MSKIIKKYSRYKFLNDNNLLIEGSEFLQYQFGIEPFQPPAGYAFAVDPKLSYYNDQDSPYTDFYARQSGLVSNLLQVTRGIDGNYSKKSDYFMEDINNFGTLKILRIFENNSRRLDVFISFEYYEEEFFGVYKDFNYIMKPQLETEIFSDIRNQMNMNQEYQIKLNNYFYKKLVNWFKPSMGFYKNLSEDVRVKDNMGQFFKLKKNQNVEVVGESISKDRDPYITIKIKEETYNIIKNDYYYFKWRFEKLN